MSKMFFSIFAAVLLAGSLLLFMLFAGLWAMYRRVYHSLASMIADFVSQPDKDTPSPLATWFDQAASILSARLVLQAKTTIMGLASAASKAEAKEQGEQVVAANPGLAAILSFIPGSKKLLRNPGLLSAAGGLLSRFSQPKSNGHTETPVSPFQM